MISLASGVPQSPDQDLGIGARAPFWPPPAPPGRLIPACTPEALVEGGLSAADCPGSSPEQGPHHLLGSPERS